MSFDIDWNEIQSLLRDRLDVKVNSGKRVITVTMKGEMPAGFSIKEALGGGDSLKPMAKVMTGKDIDFTAEPLPDGKSVELRFQDDESFKTMQEFLHDLINGDLLKELVEKLMKTMFSAFGGPDTSNS
jgi:hypothetical protein